MRHWQQGSSAVSCVSRIVRERRAIHEKAPILFDLDRGYLKVMGQGGSRCYPLGGRWAYGDSSAALVREEGTLRHTTVGAQMALLDRSAAVRSA